MKKIVKIETYSDHERIKKENEKRRSNMKIEKAKRGIKFPPKPHKKQLLQNLKLQDSEGDDF